MKNLPIILFYLLVFLAVSCGSKKKLSERSSEKVSYSINKDVVLSEIKVENARILTDSIGRRTTFTPIDPDKPSRVGETEFQNTTITQEDVSLKKEETKKDSTTTDLQDQSSEKGSSKSSSRSTDVDVKRQSPWAWFAIAGAVVLIAFLWIKFRK